jgi:hypothetical protein
MLQNKHVHGIGNTGHGWIKLSVWKDWTQYLPLTFVLWDLDIHWKLLNSTKRAGFAFGSGSQSVAGVGGPNEELGVRPLLHTADLVPHFFLLHYQHMYVCGLWVPLGEPVGTLCNGWAGYSARTIAPFSRISLIRKCWTVRMTVLTPSIEEIPNGGLPFHLIAPSACCHTGKTPINDWQSLDRWNSAPAV